MCVLVENLKGRYRGHIPIMLVAVNMSATAVSTSDNIPVMTPVIDKDAIMAVTVSLINLSVLPMFCFIAFCFCVDVNV